MDIDLEKVDVVRERTGVSYKEAKDALEEHGGDVVEAIIAVEAKHGHKWMNTMSSAGNEILENLKYIIQKGNVSRVVLKRDGEILLNIPVTAGAIGVILAPVAALLGVSAAIATKTTIEIVKNNGEVVDIREMAEETVSDIKNMVKNKKDSDTTSKKSDVILDPEDQDETLDDLDDDSDY